jgi:hypothetical protein
VADGSYGQTNIQLAADPGKHVYQHAAVRAAAAALRDLASNVIDENLGPMSHTGSI